MTYYLGLLFVDCGMSTQQFCFKSLNSDLELSLGFFHGPLLRQESVQFSTRVTLICLQALDSIEKVDFIACNLRVNENDDIQTKTLVLEL